MNDSTKILVALGASAAANCRPYMDHHVQRAHAAGLPEGDIRIALELGAKVNQGAQAKTLEYIRESISTEAGAIESGSSSCC